jgi:monooxygenase
MSPEGATEHLEVLIVGGGMSGVSAAIRLRQERPEASIAILESRDRIGGTWDLFRYPGIRSDSDMYTFAFRFQPWQGEKTIADGASIRSYLNEVAVQNGVDTIIRFGHRVVEASWSSEQARWTVRADRSDGTGTTTFTCSFLYLCSGYYNYEHGNTPEFKGRERFEGTIVHPQFWPEDLEVEGRRIVVIGSGATAMTIVPALARSAAHVTMLQRSPTYVVSLPERDPSVPILRRIFGRRIANNVVRWKNILFLVGIYQMGQRLPGPTSRFLLKQVRRALPPDFDVATHFTPRYKPGDQRLCSVPDGDLFVALSEARASVETDRIDTFTETGIHLTSGADLDADIIVTATGLDLLALGGIALSVDGRVVKVGETVAYRGMMLSGVPNMAFTMGYINATWTLKAGLIADHVCKILNFMDAQGHEVVIPREPDPAISRGPLLPSSAGYVQRRAGEFPQAAASGLWRASTNYFRDFISLRTSRVNNAALTFSTRVAAEKRSTPTSTSWK